MNKQFLISAAVLAVMSLILGFVVHVLLLGGDYAQLPQLYRGETDGNAHFGYMLLAHLLIGTGFSWVYRKGVEPGAWLVQGLRFGAAIAVLTTVPTYLIYFAVEPLPAVLVVKQILFDTAAVLVLGITVAALNRPAAS